MKAITPNHTNERADAIALELERSFPHTQFVIQPQIFVDTLYHNTHEHDGIRFTVTALLADGQVYRDIFLRFDEEITEPTQRLIADLKHLNYFPSL